MTSIYKTTRSHSENLVELQLATRVGRIRAKPVIRRLRRCSTTACGGLRFANPPYDARFRPSTVIFGRPLPNARHDARGELRQAHAQPMRLSAVCVPPTCKGCGAVPSGSSRGHQVAVAIHCRQSGGVPGCGLLRFRLAMTRGACCRQLRRRQRPSAGPGRRSRPVRR